MTKSKAFPLINAYAVPFEGVINQCYTPHENDVDVAPCKPKPYFKIINFLRKGNTIHT